MDHDALFNSRLRELIGQQVIDTMSLKVQLDIAAAQAADMQAEIARLTSSAGQGSNDDVDAGEGVSLQ